MRSNKIVFCFRSVLLIARLVAFCGAAAAQTPTRENTVTNSASGGTLPFPSHPALSANDTLVALRQKAETGDPRSQYLLGDAYRAGEGVEKNLGEAVKWYRKSADQGNADAQTALGTCYMMGDGVDKDEAAAESWFEKAAIQGDALAECKLGLGYLYGKGGLIQNEIEGIAWIETANLNGDEDAARLISLTEVRYSPSVILASRQRAAEIQAKLGSAKPVIDAKKN